MGTWYEKLTHWKRHDAGKDWGQKEKRMTEDEMVGWHHWLNGHEFEQALGVGDRQGSLHAAVPGVAESDRTERQNWTELIMWGGNIQAFHLWCCGLWCLEWVVVPNPIPFYLLQEAFSKLIVHSSSLLPQPSLWSYNGLPTLLCDCLCVVLISLRVMLFACLLLWQSSTWQVAVTNKCLSNASTCDHVDT